MKKYWILLLALMVPLSVSISMSGCTDSGATTGVINGYTWFSDNGGGETQARYVSVTINGHAYASTDSGSSGVYSFTGVAPGMYTVTANYGVGFPEKPGSFTPVSWEANHVPADNDGAYYIYVYNITVTAGNTSSVDFTLKGTSPI